MTAAIRLQWFTAGYGWVTVVAPIVIASPVYFAGDLTFGGLMMAAAAFTQVHSSLRWFVDNIGAIADWRATLMRVASFRLALIRAGEGERQRLTRRLHSGSGQGFGWTPDSAGASMLSAEKGACHGRLESSLGRRVPLRAGAHQGERAAAGHHGLPLHRLPEDEFVAPFRCRRRSPPTGSR